MRQLRRISDALLATIFPTPCHVCEQLVEQSADGIACQSCWDAITPFNDADICQRCGYPLALAEGIPAPPDCHRCRQWHFHLARSIASYQGALRASILNLKTRPYLCRRLTDHLYRLAAEQFPSCELLLPVPLHRDRLRERGFNQAAVIAERLARQLAKPLETECLVRTKATARQRAGLDIVDRMAGVANAFQVRRPELIADRSLLLTDDVFTTGSTVSACAAALLDAGAKEVNVITLARTVI